LEDPEDLDDLGLDPWAFARDNGVNILANKDFRAAYTVADKLVAVLFDASDSDGYEFDIAVTARWRRRGLGAKLTDYALSIYEETSDAYGEDYTLNLDVINPAAEAMLAKRGLVVVGRERGHTLMTRR
jgi:GNAT superfamily N-acetyltransferase